VSAWTDSIILKSSDEIDRMREAGRIVGGCLDLAGKLLKPGVSTGKVDRQVEEYIRSEGAIPSFKGYMDYPATACISVNEEVVHGIPGSRVLQEGDIVGFDIGAIWEGYHGDAARTFAIGDISDAARKLMQVTRESLQRGLDQVKEGNRVGDIGHAIQAHAEAHGYGVVRSLVGHGIGQSLHEKPQVPNYGNAGKGIRLRTGMVLAIEPMLNEGSAEVYTKRDQWTIVTVDSKLSAHYEQTIAITEQGPEVLTGALHTGFADDQSGSLDGRAIG
jgi:methionyl aminopeptidase